MEASETFEMGEPVNMLTAGTIEEAATAAGWTTANFTSGGTKTAGMLGGIACHGPGAGNLHPDTGVAYATNDRIDYWPLNQGTHFITSTFYATGDTSTAVTPATTDVGEAYQVTSDGTTWGLEQTGAQVGTNVQANVVDVLDINKAPIRITSGTGVYLVFTLTASEAQPD
jgi:hypothetical protein